MCIYVVCVLCCCAHATCAGCKINPAIYREAKFFLVLIIEELRYREAKISKSTPFSLFQDSGRTDELITAMQTNRIYFKTKHRNRLAIITRYRISYSLSSSRSSKPSMTSDSSHTSASASNSTLSNNDESIAYLYLSISFSVTPTNPVPLEQD